MSNVERSHFDTFASLISILNNRKCIGLQPVTRTRCLRRVLKSSNLGNIQLYYYYGHVNCQASTTATSDAGDAPTARRHAPARVSAGAAAGQPHRDGCTRCVFFTVTSGAPFAGPSPHADARRAVFSVSCWCSPMWLRLPPPTATDRCRLNY